jgi:hypothetical protein
MNILLVRIYRKGLKVILKFNTVYCGFENHYCSLYPVFETLATLTALGIIVCRDGTTVRIQNWKPIREGQQGSSLHHHVKHDPGLPQSPIQYAPWASPAEMKRPEREAHHSYPYIGNVWNTWCSTSVTCRESCYFKTLLPLIYFPAL